MFAMDSRIDVILNADQAKQLGIVQKVNALTPQKKSEIMALSATHNIAAFAPNISATITKTEKPIVMTAAEFKAAHPAAHAEIVQEAATAERDRVGSWMAFAEVDPTAVKAGIESGNGISQTQMSEFALKAHSKKAIADVQADGAPAIKTSEIKPEDIAAKASVDAFTAEVKANLKKAIN
jgi:hypothetical protein